MTDTADILASVPREAIEAMARKRHAQRVLEPGWRPWAEFDEFFHEAALKDVAEQVAALYAAGFCIATLKAEG